MILGIIGAENSHSKAIATILNVEKKMKGISVGYLWGETAAFANDTAEAGRIPNIVKRPKDMLGNVDAVLVDHRHPKYHLPAVRPFVERGIPVFVDKPFCFDPKEGAAFLKLAKKTGAPVTSFSVVPMQASFQKFKKNMEGIGNVVAGSTYGPCDLESPWGGVFFYGIHQVEMALMAFGYDVKSVLITKNGNGSTGQLLYRDGKIVTMNLVREGAPRFGIAATGSDKAIHSGLPMDKSPYLNGVKTFCGMFRTGVEPIPHDLVLRPVQVLDALARSKKSGRVEKVIR